MTATWIETANREATLIERIRAMLRMDNGVSFAELGQFDGFRGGLALCAGGEGNSNLVLWPEVSEEAAAALTALIAGGECHIAPASLFTYIADGCVPSLPIAKSRRSYARPHWVPGVLCRGPETAAASKAKPAPAPRRRAVPRKRQLVPGKLRARR